MEVENYKMSGIPLSQQQLEKYRRSSGVPKLQHQIDRERKAAETHKQITKAWERVNKPVHPSIEGAIKAAKYLPLAAGAAAGIGVGISKLVKHVRKKHQERKKKLRFK